AASLVPAQVQDDAAPLLRDALHGGVQLGPAVAALGVQDVAGEAFGVDADEDVVAVADVAQDHRDVLAAVGGAGEADRAPHPVPVGQAGLHHAGDHRLGAP